VRKNAKIAFKDYYAVIIRLRQVYSCRVALPEGIALKDKNE